jgi:hypothetical protein
MQISALTDGILRSVFKQVGTFTVEDSICEIKHRISSSFSKLL